MGLMVLINGEMKVSVVMIWMTKLTAPFILPFLHLSLSPLHYPSQQQTCSLCPSHLLFPISFLSAQLFILCPKQLSLIFGSVVHSEEEEKNKIKRKWPQLRGSTTRKLQFICGWYVCLFFVFLFVIYLCPFIIFIILLFRNFSVY